MEIVIHYNFNRQLISGLITSLSKQNYEYLDFTLHTEDDHASIRLSSHHTHEIFDSSLSIEVYAKRITSMLRRNKIDHSVIETVAFMKTQFPSMPSYSN